MSTGLTAKVKLAELRGMVWYELFMNRRLIISEIIFENPAFELIVEQDTSKRKAASTSVQSLFGDILARASLSDFRLENGSFRLFRKSDEELEEVASIKSLNFFADGIITDSVQWNYPIPFKMEAFYSTISGIHTRFGNNQVLDLGKLTFNSKEKQFSLDNVSMKYEKSWKEVAREMGVQKDMSEFELGRLESNKIDALSSFLGEKLDIRANSIVVSDLDFRDHRDKNIPRPPDKEKPMFEGMIASIPISLEIDSIMIKDSRISYEEIPKGSSSGGVIQFDRVFGTVYNVTTIPEFKADYNQFEADIIARLNGTGKIKLRLEVPYSKESFRAYAEVNEFDMTKMSATLVPMAGVRIISGDLINMDLSMNASRTLSSNVLVMDYENLHVEILDSEKHKEKKGLLSSVANLAIRQNNHPDDNNYVITEYSTERNIYRGPFKLIFSSMKDGIMQIVPSKTTRKILAKKK
jgi:hypothetical protein